MEIWNSEEPTRLPDDPTSDLISIIDITASRGDISIEWAITGEEHETGSDHQLIVWEVAETEKKPTLILSTEWDLSGWDPTGCGHRRGRSRGGRLCLSFVISFVTFLGAQAFLRGQGGAEGTRGACNEPPRADCGQENLANCTPP